MENTAMRRYNPVLLEDCPMPDRTERKWHLTAHGRPVGLCVIPRLLGITFVAWLSVTSGGCASDMFIEDPTTAPSDEPAPATDPSTATVTIRFRNVAVDEAVNVEFYATNDPTVELPDGLFVEQNLVTASIGVAGTGILEPLRDDTLEFPCTEQLVVGTLGGTFLDNETGEERGTGVARWARDTALGLCGHKILFEFSNEFGTFTTRVAIGD